MKWGNEFPFHCGNALRTHVVWICAITFGWRVKIYEYFCYCTVYTQPEVERAILWMKKIVSNNNNNINGNDDDDDDEQINKRHIKQTKAGDEQQSGERKFVFCPESTSFKWECSWEMMNHCVLDCASVMQTFYNSYDWRTHVLGRSSYYRGMLIVFVLLFRFSVRQKLTSNRSKCTLFHHHVLSLHEHHCTERQHHEGQNGAE